MPDVFTLHRGSAPLLLSLPHDGSLIPESLQSRMTPPARIAPDTDWHVSRLYDFARELGASILVPRYSRYVIDLNRGEDDTSLYPGQNTTGLVPLVRFTGEPVYLPGAEPDAHAMGTIEKRPHERSALADEANRRLNQVGHIHCR